MKQKKFIFITLTIFISISAYRDSLYAMIPNNSNHFISKQKKHLNKIIDRAIVSLYNDKVISIDDARHALKYYIPKDQYDNHYPNAQFTKSYLKSILKKYKEHNLIKIITTLHENGEISSDTLKRAYHLIHSEKGDYYKKILASKLPNNKLVYSKKRKSSIFTEQEPNKSSDITINKVVSYPTKDLMLLSYKIVKHSFLEEILTGQPLSHLIGPQSDASLISVISISLRYMKYEKSEKYIKELFSKIFHNESPRFFEELTRYSMELLIKEILVLQNNVSRYQKYDTSYLTKELLDNLYNASKSSDIDAKISYLKSYLSIFLRLLTLNNEQQRAIHFLEFAIDNLYKRYKNTLKLQS